MKMRNSLSRKGVRMEEKDKEGSRGRKRNKKVRKEKREMMESIS